MERALLPSSNPAKQARQFDFAGGLRGEFTHQTVIYISEARKEYSTPFSSASGGLSRCPRYFVFSPS